MGDRVTVRVTVLKAHADTARTILENGLGISEEETLDTTVEFTIEEVNYGNLECEHLLIKAGVAYDKNWGAGSEFTEGDEYGRFMEDGSFRVFDVYSDSVNPDLDKLLEKINDPDELKAYILKFAADTTPLPLDGRQVEYAKRYLAVKLIAPD